MLLELETTRVVVQSHTKNKIGNSFKLHVTLIEYSFDEIYIYCFENRLILKPPKIYRSSRTGVFLGTGALVICSKFTGEQPCRSTMPCNFIEIALRHGCSPVNFLYIFRTSFPKNAFRRLLLNIYCISDSMFL